MVLSALASPARAGERQAHARGARVVVIGGVDPAPAQVASAAIGALSEQGWAAAIERSASIQLVEALRACYGGNRPDACRKASASGSEHVLAIEITGGAASAGGDVTLTAWLVNEEGELLLAERRYCEPCAGAGLDATTRDLVAFILRETAGTSARSMIRIRTTPTGARVLVDGKPVGVSDLEYTVYAGRHQIAVDKPGYRIEVREVDTPSGATVNLEVALEESRAVRGDGGGGAALPLALGAAGALAIAGGVTLMAIDSPRTDGMGAPNSEFRQSFWPGVGVTAAGVALAGAGLWLWLRRPARRESPSPSVGFFVEGGGAWLVGSGRF